MGITISRRNWFVSQNWNISYTNTSVFQKNSGIQKFMDKRGGGGENIRTFCRLFFVSQYRRIRRGTLRCSRKFRVSKNFMHKRSISGFSIDYYLSHSTKELRRGTLPCLRKIVILKIFMHKRGRSITVLRRFFFVSECRKLSQGNL